MNVEELTTIDQWESLKDQSTEHPVLVFKHSTTCPISGEAYNQFHAFLEEGTWTGKVALVKVIEARPVSNKIAEDLGIKHESPQAIVIKDGEGTWNASHWNITKKALAALT